MELFLKPYCAWCVTGGILFSLPLDTGVTQGRLCKNSTVPTALEL